MMIILLLLVFAIICFSIGAGSVIYFKMFVRGDKPGIPPIPDNFDGKDVEIKGVGDAASHVHDPVIMAPLLEAKRRWASYPLEKLHIIGAKGTLLCADLWLADDFEKSSKRFAILVHGMTDSSSGMAYLAEEYHKLGINVLAVNLCSHGESYGKTYGLGYKDSWDILKWMELICKKYGEDSKFILHGVSMGGATVFNTIALGRFRKPEYVDKVILTVEDSGFSNWMEQISNQVNNGVGSNFFQKIVVFLVIKGLSFCSFVAGNGFMEKFSPAKNLLKATAEKGFDFPILIFHGTKDILVKPSQAQELYDSIHNQQKKELILVEGAPHIGPYFYEKEMYMKKIKDCLFAEKE